MKQYHNPAPDQTLTTAREALPYVYHPGVSPELWAESLAKVNAAFDYAEKLQSALSVTQEEGRTEIARLEVEVEKLKAERDSFAATVVSLAADRDRLTSQLEQAREIISPFADAARSFTVSIAPDGIDDGLTVTARIFVMPDYEAVLSTYHFSRASQWIKDRQAKGEG